MPSSSDDLSRWGLRRTLGKSALIQAERWTSSRLFVVQETDNLPFSDDKRLPVPPDVTIQCVSFDAAMTLAADPEYQLRPALVEFIRDHGHEIWGLFVEDRLVHYAIRGAGVAPAEDGLVLRLGDSHVYYYKSLTLPEWRGRGFSHLRTQLTRDLFQGKRGAWSIFYVSPYNYASLRANEKLPATTLGYAGYTRISGAFRFFASQRVRQAGFRFDLPVTDEERSVVNA